MSTPTPNRTLVQVPLTLEGAAVLHQVFRIDRAKLDALTAKERNAAMQQATALLATQEQGPAGAWSSLYSVLGHKGDLLWVHFRPELAAVRQAEQEVARLELSRCLTPGYSFVSVVELGLYESSIKLYQQLAARGLEPFTEVWNREIEATVSRQREAMKPRLFPEPASQPWICFYPMDRKRGEHKNWYRLPIEERNRQMQEHGAVGRRYADSVRQIITGSIGFDDWEWGVTLFAEDPLVFKKLIYEMRFDEVSADYALFGQFFVGMRVRAAELAGALS